MCRIFGFRSVIQSKVHSSLLSADNALITQSTRHPDGWGVAYYVGGAPHVVKSAGKAFQDSLFERVSGVVSSQTVVAHIRKSTQGEKTILNTHPFQFGKWIFVHNGNIKDFDLYKERLRAMVGAQFKPYILGQTDSEILFFILLTNLSKRIDIHRKGCQPSEIIDSVHETIEQVTALVGPYEVSDDKNFKQTFLTFLITNGHSLVGYHGGQPLFYSTYKTKCADRTSCPRYAPECENPTTSGYVNHMILSSEPLQGENIWTQMKPGEAIGVDWSMRLIGDNTNRAPHPTNGLATIGRVAS